MAFRKNSKLLVKFKGLSGNPMLSSSKIVERREIVSPRLFKIHNRQFPNSKMKIIKRFR